MHSIPSIYDFPWKPGAPTYRPPQDDTFFYKIYEAGYRVYATDSNSLAIATSKERRVNLICRGGWNRWELGFCDNNGDEEYRTVFIANVHNHVKLAIFWLEGKPWGEIQLLIDGLGSDKWREPYVPREDNREF